VLEDIKLRLQGPGEFLGFGAIQEDWQNVRLEQAKLCVDTDAGLPNPALGAAHAVAALVRLLSETADKLHMVARHQNMIGHRVLQPYRPSIGLMDCLSLDKIIIKHRGEESIMIAKHDQPNLKSSYIS